MCYSALVKRDLSYLEHSYGSVLIRDQVDDYLKLVAQDPKRFPPLDDRIYPGHYAPIVHLMGERRIIEVMRYGAYPKPTIAAPQRYTTFNARRDNLSSPFWSAAFLEHHGFVVLNGFYEWVAVRDLLGAGVVSLAQIEDEFLRQAEERKAKVLGAGKRYKPTPTELTEPRLRRIVIEFKPADGADLIVPVIYAYGKLPNGRWDAGFAIVTDEPPPEIRAAGHDRCPVVLSQDAIGAWLDVRKKAPKDLDSVLANHRRVSFAHKLAEAS